MKYFIDSMKKFRVLWFFTFLVLLLAIVSVADRSGKAAIVYSESLEQVIATVEGEPLTLRDFAVYVAHQEDEVESQALVYDDTNTNKYWNIHTNGRFIKYAARDAALGMAVHDALFYQIAQEMKLSLSEEEEAILVSDVMDFWMDLTDDGKEQRLGITKADAEAAFRRIALAEKAQFIYEEMDNVEHEGYNYGKEAYERFLSDYEYTVEEAVLDRLSFGNITLDH
uniref:hypothetical protein n=1 Tax=Agathobacter sp. TaxID=2021311 RepID=UPI004055B089